MSNIRIYTQDGHSSGFTSTNGSEVLVNVLVPALHTGNWNPLPPYQNQSMPAPKTPCHADPVPSAESGSPTGSPSQQQELEGYLIRLIDALAEQTTAINRLASSNEALIQAMAQSEGLADEDAQPGSYLNGSPVR